jgi:UDP-N-acetylglucosamine:LPS N-acetylglucosamine transferase
MGKAAEKQRRYRERLAQDPARKARQQQYEREKYLRKKAAGMIVPVSSMTTEEIAKQRKKWRLQKEQWRSKVSYVAFQSHENSSSKEFAVIQQFINPTDEYSYP